MSTIKVKGQEVQVGDDLWSGGTPHRITRIKDYTHPLVTRGEPWRTAICDGPGGEKAWGITLSYAHGFMAGYEVTALPGDKRGEPHRPDDDYLCPFFGMGADLYPHYAAAGFPGLWTEWLATLDDPAALAATEADCAAIADYVNSAGDRFRWNPERKDWEMKR